MDRSQVPGSQKSLNRNITRNQEVLALIFGFDQEVTGLTTKILFLQKDPGSLLYFTGLCYWFMMPADFQ